MVDHSVVRARLPSTVTILYAALDSLRELHRKLLSAPCFVAAIVVVVAATIMIVVRCSSARAGVPQDDRCSHERDHRPVADIAVTVAAISVVLVAVVALVASGIALIC